MSSWAVEDGSFLAGPNDSLLMAKSNFCRASCCVPDEMVRWYKSLFCKRRWWLTRCKRRKSAMQRKALTFVQVTPSTAFWLVKTLCKRLQGYILASISLVLGSFYRENLGFSSSLTGILDLSCANCTSQMCLLDSSFSCREIDGSHWLRSRTPSSVAGVSVFSSVA